MCFNASSSIRATVVTQEQSTPVLVFCTGGVLDMNPLQSQVERTLPVDCHFTEIPPTLHDLVYPDRGAVIRSTVVMGRRVYTPTSFYIDTAWKTRTHGQRTGSGLAWVGNRELAADIFTLLVSHHFSREQVTVEAMGPSHAEM
jgi:hypothetical protein